MKRALIGSETEYGIILEGEQGNYGRDHSYYIHRAIEDMIDEAERFIGGITRDRETFEDIAAHEEAERELRNNESDDESEEEVFGQRRGYSGAFLTNGARFYIDMCHPEYSCPETSDPYSALCVQKAGDLIVQECARRSQKNAHKYLRESAKILIAKNNSDGRRSSYAGHENYSIARPLFDKICLPGTHECNATKLFFVVRQIITGAGKIGSEWPHGNAVPYQLSQRADFFVTDESTSTTDRRGVINLRNWTYGDPSQHARFHVIVGDSNRSDLSLFLKFGMSALFFMMLEDGHLAKESAWYGASMLTAHFWLRTISRDTNLRKKIRFVDGRGASALDVMIDLCACAEKFVAKSAMDPVWHRVVELWRKVLEGLSGERHKHELVRSLDWVALERLLHARMKKTGESIDSEGCRELELSYRILNATSVFNAMVERGAITQIAKKEDVERHVYEPPEGRAYVRAEIIKRYGNLVDHVRWDRIFFGLYRVSISLPDPQWGSREQTRALFANKLMFTDFVALASTYPPTQIEICNDRRTW